MKLARSRIQRRPDAGFISRNLSTELKGPEPRNVQIIPKLTKKHTRKIYIIRLVQGVRKMAFKPDTVVQIPRAILVLSENLLHMHNTSAFSDCQTDIYLPVSVSELVPRHSHKETLFRPFPLSLIPLSRKPVPLHCGCGMHYCNAFTGGGRNIVKRADVNYIYCIYSIFTYVVNVCTINKF